MSPADHASGHPSTANPSPIIIVPKYARVGEGFTVRERAASLEHPGRRVDGSQTAAAWVADLTDLRKMIVLCGWCRERFNPRRHGYRRRFVADASGKTDGFEVSGRCVACKQPTINTPGNGVAFMSEEAFAALCIDPAEARRRARAHALAAWGRMTVQERLRSLLRWRGSRRPHEAATQKGVRSCA